jgi:hypothetical protein
MYVICDTLINPSGLCLSDLNNDSLPDVIAGSYSRKLDWFENEGAGTGIMVADDNLAVDVQKDPITGIISIHFKNVTNSLYEAQLVDTMGRICFSTISRISPVNIRTKQLQPGTYLLRILSSGKQYIVKLYFE